MYKDFADLLSELNAHHVEYLVVGGYAVGAYSEPRATKDLDILIRGDEKNSEALFQALVAFGAPLAGHTADDFNNKPTSIFQMGQPPIRVDILQSIPAVTFDEAWEQRAEAKIAGVVAPLISAEHLIQNKLASGTLRDLADVQAVQDALATPPKPPKDSRLHLRTLRRVPFAL